MKETEASSKANEKVINAVEKLADMGPDTGHAKIANGLEELQQAVKARGEGREGEAHRISLKEARKGRRTGLKVELHGVVVNGGKATAYKNLTRRYPWSTAVERGVVQSGRP
ncbi:hypothetical protein Tdes44962_MAKER02875 [Teratosphaeria destructans]|uniref:Uncharacterized protein n=1 Tax=Teratosphaeria destructans TaxID=418781 RepID=A0A9W7SRT2_9PEZI|nr:hypothetical protein Tdes44962_MAKER02875 [Teratosphaeria destructans]